MRWLRGRGITTSLDTNGDPAEQWAGLDEMLPLVDVVLPNAAETVALAAALAHSRTADPSAGQPADQRADDRAARVLAGYGCRVVVKAGPAGARVYDPDGTVVVATGLELPVVDTTGAGDSFDAGYLAAAIHGIVDPVEQVRWGAVAGSLSVRGTDGTARQPTLAELRAALDE